MGTSNPFGGQRGGTLTPSWLGGGEDGSAPPSVGQGDGNSGDNNESPEAPAERPAISPIAGNHFQTPRTNFTGFASSGGSNRRKLGRAVSGYISSSGGSSAASHRMGSSRTASANLAGFLTSVRADGVDDALRERQLGNLAGRPIEEIFVAMSDYICPDNGTIDEGIARSAFIETIADLAEIGIQDMGGLTNDQIQTVLEHYAAHAIEARIYNDIGTKINFAPDSIQAVEQVQDMLGDFILRGVADAYSQAKVELENLTPDSALQFTDQVYEEAFSILQSLADNEAEAK